MGLEHFDTTGLTLYAKANDGSHTCVALAEGTSLGEQYYTASDGAITTAGLAAGTYSWSVHIGSAISPDEADEMRGHIGPFHWSGSAEITFSADCVQRLDRSAKAIVLGTVASSSTTGLVKTSSLAPSPTQLNQYKRRVLIFDKNTTTAALRGVATDILTTGATLTTEIPVTALSTAPVSGDTFTIT